MTEKLLHGSVGRILKTVYKKAVGRFQLILSPEVLTKSKSEISSDFSIIEKKKKF